MARAEFCSDLNLDLRKRDEERVFYLSLSLSLSLSVMQYTKFCLCYLAYHRVLPQYTEKT